MVSVGLSVWISAEVKQTIEEVLRDFKARENSFKIILKRTSGNVTENRKNKHSAAMPNAGRSLHKTTMQLVEANLPYQPS